MKIPAARVTRTLPLSSFSAAIRKIMRTTSAFLNRLSLRAPRAWVKNSGRKRRVQSKCLNFSEIVRPPVHLQRNILARLTSRPASNNRMSSLAISRTGRLVMALSLPISASEQMPCKDAHKMRAASALRFFSSSQKNGSRALETRPQTRSTFRTYQTGNERSRDSLCSNSIRQRLG